MALNYRPIVLIILDGFGIAPKHQANAISVANKPFWDKLIQEYPSLLLQASGESVGLPWGEVGNSEVGHFNIGSGILRYQSLPRIDKSVSTGQFYKLELLQNVPGLIKSKKANLHLVGLLGNGGVHASQQHLEALVNFAKVSGIGQQTYLHLFMDGRDTAKDAGKKFMADILKFCQAQKAGQVATLGGRFYGMDRNKNWDRIEKAYRAIVLAEGEKHREPIKAIEESYEKKIFDEEMAPMVFTDKKSQPLATISDNDVVIFFNFRGDRSRQLASALVTKNFNGFSRPFLPKILMITFTEYEKGLPVQVLFPPELTENSLARIFSEYNMKQLHIAETEKYAHVTFFFNGLKEEPFVGEERILIPSPNISSYDQQPAMSAFEVTKNILAALKKNKFDFIVINYANPDMVAHTGNLKATIKAIEAVDGCLAKIIPEIVKKNGIAFVLADHGNAEELINPITGDIDKEHNSYPVPFLILANKFLGQGNPGLINGDMSIIQPSGILADVAPTVLKISGLAVASEMTGTSLL